MRVRTACVAVLLGTLLLCSACRRQAAPPSLDDLAHRYVVLMVELGERDLDSLDFYVGTDQSIEELRKHPESFESLHRSALALRTQVEQLTANTVDDERRKELLLRQIDAMVLRTEQVQGHNRSFDEESRTFFGVVAPADDDAAARKQARAQIASLLGNAAHPAQAYDRFDARFVVPPERVPVVMQLALQQCRALTLQHMSLPPGEHVDVEYVAVKPWAAFSRYLGNAHSLIQINMDFPMTVDRALDLACHEGYPGHHVFNTMRDVALVQRQHREEFRVQPTFSPQSYVSEAAASYAPHMVLGEGERLRIERDVLAPAAGLTGLDFERYLALQALVDRLHTAEPSIAREYLDGMLEFERAAEALEHETLMEHGESTLLYLNEFRTYMLAYTQGVDSMRAYVEAGEPTDAERWRRYVALMMEPVVSIPSR